MYAGVVEKVKGVSLDLDGAVVGFHFFDFALWHAGLTEGVVNGHCEPVLFAEFGGARYFGLEG